MKLWKPVNNKMETGAKNFLKKMSERTLKRQVFFKTISFKIKKVIRIIKTDLHRCSQALMKLPRYFLITVEKESDIQKCITLKAIVDQRQLEKIICENLISLLSQK